MKKERSLLLYLKEADHTAIKARATYIGISMNKYIYEAICDRYEKEAYLGWPNDLKPKQE